MPRDELRLGAKLGSGAESVVWSVANTSELHAGGELAYKEYRDAASNRISITAFASITGLWQRLDDDEVEFLADATVWPVAVVATGRIATGVLLPQISTSYLHKAQLTQGVEVIPREVQHLFVAAKRNAQVGLDYATEEQRFVVCGQVAGLFAVLHDHGVVYGDLNARNLLYRLRPTPAALLLDCDGARVSSTSAARRQLHSPDWEPPEGGLAQSQQTDLYKLGLFFLRSLVPGPFASTNRDAARADAVLDPDGRALLRASLSTSGPRPPAREWTDYFRDVRGPDRTMSPTADRAFRDEGDPHAVLFDPGPAIAAPTNASPPAAPRTGPWELVARFAMLVLGPLALLQLLAHALPGGPGPIYGVTLVLVVLACWLWSRFDRRVGQQQEWSRGRSVAVFGALTLPITMILAIGLSSTPARGPSFQVGDCVEVVSLAAVAVPILPDCPDDTGARVAAVVAPSESCAEEVMAYLAFEGEEPLGTRVATTVGLWGFPQLCLVWNTTAPSVAAGFGPAARATAAGGRCWEGTSAVPCSEPWRFAYVGDVDGVDPIRARRSSSNSAWCEVQLGPLSREWRFVGIPDDAGLSCGVARTDGSLHRGPPPRPAVG